MVYVNRNNATKQLKSIVELSLKKNLDYLPSKFNKEQYNALILLQKRIQLEEIIDESLEFNKSLNFKPNNSNLHLVSSAEELVDVFSLRSEVYLEMGYNKEFPEIIEGLNFDAYDKNSAIIYYGQKNKASGSVRLIFDSANKLPIEKEYPFNSLRNQYSKIGEFSRLVARSGTKGLGLEFKYLMNGIYNIVINNNVDQLISVIIEDHYKLYSKFGAISVIDKLDTYGTLDLPALIISWDPNKISKFFKRAILS